MLGGKRTEAGGLLAGFLGELVEPRELLRELPLLRCQLVKDASAPLFELQGGAQLLIGSLVILSEPSQPTGWVLALPIREPAAECLVRPGGGFELRDPRAAFLDAPLDSLPLLLGAFLVVHRGVGRNDEPDARWRAGIGIQQHGGGTDRDDGLRQQLCGCQLLACRFEVVAAVEYDPVN